MCVCVFGPCMLARNHTYTIQIKHTRANVWFSARTIWSCMGKNQTSRDHHLYKCAANESSTLWDAERGGKWAKNVIEVGGWIMINTRDG